MPIGVILRSFLYTFVSPEGQKIILTTQKHWESIRNGIVDLRKRYHDHEKRQRADFQKSAVFWGGVKQTFPPHGETQAGAKALHTKSGCRFYMGDTLPTTESSRMS